MAMANERHTDAREHLQWAFEGAPSKASKYHLIDLTTGVSHGGFETLFGARQCAREKHCRPETSSTAIFGSSTTIRAETRCGHALGSVSVFRG